MDISRVTDFLRQSCVAAWFERVEKAYLLPKHAEPATDTSEFSKYPGIFNDADVRYYVRFHNYGYVSQDLAFLGT